MDDKTNDDIVKAVHESRRAFNSGQNRSVKERKEYLRRLYRFYTDCEPQLVNCLKEDLGKHYFESIVTEVNHLQTDCRLMLNNVDKWTRSITVQRSLSTALDHPYLQPEPYGVVLVMGAWNYPLQLTMLPVAAAIAAGNCVVIKPPDLAPATSRFLEHELPNYLDPRCFPVICGGAERCQLLLQQRFDYILYTGGKTVGKLVHAAANRYLTPTTLELGGKSPVFLDDSVNMEYAARRIIWGKIVNLGQTCIAPDYLICSRSTEKLFLQHAGRILEQWFEDDALNSEEIGRIVNDGHFKRLTTLLERTRGTVELGGRFCDQSRRIEPTVVSGVAVDDPLMREEIFGPILPIVNFETAEDAVDFINSREKPLVLYIFSRRSAVIRKFSTSTSSGSVAVNEILMQYTVDQLPFGGVGSSGMGAFHGKASFDTFTHYKSVLHRSFNPIVEKLSGVRYPPYTQRKLKLARLLLRNPTLPSLAPLKYMLVFSAGVLAMHLANYLIQYTSAEGHS